MHSTAQPSTPGLSTRVRAAVRTLEPGYFALVMASGIASMGLKLQGYEHVSAVLLWVCAASYVLLIVLTGMRLLRYRREVATDLSDAGQAFGFFTFVAGTNVLGGRLAMDGHSGWTVALLVVAVASWLVLGYVVPWTAVLRKPRRQMMSRANGTWFIWVVASQSIAAAAATLQAGSGAASGWLALLAVLSWGVGVFLYALVGVIVVLRMMLYELRPQDLSASYWVAMGACAITVVAGARIVEMDAAPIVIASRGLVAGMCVVFWAFATWLIPPLLAAGWWRHARHRVPLRYEAGLWSMVFPLGMYGVAGISLGQADALPIVGTIGALELWLALGVWCLVFVAMLANMWRSVLRPATPTPAGG